MAAALRVDYACQFAAMGVSSAACSDGLSDVCPGGGGLNADMALTI
jgi:hypothetical protein